MLLESALPHSASRDRLRVDGQGLGASREGRSAGEGRSASYDPNAEAGGEKRAQAGEALSASHSSLSGPRPFAQYSKGIGG